MHANRASKYRESECKLNLNNTSLFAEADPSGMLGLTASFPAQCRAGAEISNRWLQTAAAKPVQNIVICGLGGSAIGGDMVAALALQGGKVPVRVHRGYGVPGFVGSKTLVVAASYSGCTEETLSAYTAARSARAQVVCVTSGGTLGEWALRDNVPTISIPGGQPPRASTGYMFFPALAATVAYGLFAESPMLNCAEAFTVLDEVFSVSGPDVPTRENRAKQMATALYGRIPIVYAAAGICSVAALRWKTQFNENAKQHLFCNELPEMNHNEILAWTACSQQAEKWSVVFLRDASEEAQNPAMRKRVEVTRRVIGKAAPQTEIWSHGTSPLARLLSLFYVGDYASIYMALLNGQDPTVIPGIDRLKHELAQTKPTA